MKEIKFRAWIDKKSKWSGASEVGMFTGFTFENIYSGNDEANINCEDGRIIEEPQWDKVIIMQYTGRKDKNGKEIYEGDVVRCPLNTKWGQIVRNGEVKSEHIGHCMVNFNEVDGLPLEDAIYIANRQGVEVIGNVYENGNLLNGK